MSSWGNNDNAANAPYWAVNSAIVHGSGAGGTANNVSAPTAANVALLYANTTANVYISRQTVGLFGVDASEASADNHVHTGWVLRTVGQGGRAGRVQEEVLVAMSNMSADGLDGDAQTYANVTISLATLSDVSILASSSNANSSVITVTPTLDGNTSATLTYQWQVNDSGALGWTNVANTLADPAGTYYVGGTTASLRIIPKTTGGNGYVYRAVVTAADQGVVAYSSNSTLTVA